MAGTYLEINYALSQVSGSLEDEKDQTWVSDTVDESNIQIENDLRDIYKSFPTDPASDLFISFRNAALAWFKFKWAERERDKEGVEMFTKEYNLKKNGLKKVSQREETGSHRFSGYY